MNKFVLAFICMILLQGCCRNSDLESALRFAGDNRVELEKVLEHYAADPDPLKLKAARFLIENMPGHCSYDSDGMELFAQLAMPVILSDLSIGAKKRSLEAVSASVGNRIRIVQDARTITANYLIRNIDDAFRLWREELWAGHLEFDEFCEYLLPYKVVELQPLDRWRDSLRHTFDTMRSRALNSEEYTHQNLDFTRAVNHKMKNELKVTDDLLITDYSGYPFLCSSTIGKIPFGTCKDFCISGMAVMRSKGIPIALDYTPQWGNRRLGHTWNVLLRNYGKICEFAAVADADPGELHKPHDRRAKVYRYTYARNPEMAELLRHEKFPPKNFRSVFIRDVTDQYMKVASVEIPIKFNRDMDNRFAYLAIFDNNEWVPFTFGKRSGRKFIFDNVGLDYVLLPVYSTERGLVPLNHPFRLTYDGTVEFLAPNATSEQTFRLSRKYPARHWVYDASARIMGGKFQAANKADFSDAVTLFQVDKWYSQLSFKIDAIPPHRYWRYYSADGNHCFISELIFFDREDTVRQLRGRIIGTDGSRENNMAKTKEAAFDGDPLTHFDAATPDGGWAGMDFGKPVSLSKIICYPASDANFIQIGDTYEFYYWETDRWQSVGRQVAQDSELIFTNVPANGLYLLDDITRGREKRPFTWENEKQVWW
ncbi:MAG: hypothetical protein LBH06_07710 [Rikenellaceae bacterium]|jgi:hypothetical protein|nr:hypothetical protein [Rikenellaceae bacterium]